MKYPWIRLVWFFLLLGQVSGIFSWIAPAPTAFAAIQFGINAAPAMQGSGESGDHSMQRSNTFAPVSVIQHENTWEMSIQDVITRFSWIAVMVTNQWVRSPVMRQVLTNGFVLSHHLSQFVLKRTLQNETLLPQKHMILPHEGIRPGAHTLTAEQRDNMRKSILRDMISGVFLHMADTNVFPEESSHGCVPDVLQWTYVRSWQHDPKPWHENTGCRDIDADINFGYRVVNMGDVSLALVGATLEHEYGGNSPYPLDQVATSPILLDAVERGVLTGKFYIRMLKY